MHKTHRCHVHLTQRQEETGADIELVKRVGLNTNTDVVSHVTLGDAYH
jgi:hypothetical protein